MLKRQRTTYVIGCNKLENPLFRGQESCNLVQNPIDKIKQILEIGEQTRL